MAKKRRIIEWLGGIIPMPAYVTGEGEPYRPETLLWLGADGAVLGNEVARPGEVIGLASGSLQRTIESPVFGRPHTPERVRVASPDLAAALRAGHPGLEIICAPTPELDEVAASMRAHMTKNLPESEPSYLSDEISVGAVAALFRAAARLFRAAPWKVVPGEQNLIAVTIESLDLHEAVITVIGQLGESFGLVLFSSIDAFYDYLAGVDTIQKGGEASLPPHFSLNFERGADLPASLRKEIAAHRWEVAGPTAYPWLVSIDSSATPCAAEAEDLTIAEAIATALTKVLSERKALEAAWRGGEPVERALTVETHTGNVEVELRIPFEPSADDDDDLLERFADAEGEAFADLQWSSFLVDMADQHFRAALPALGAADLRDIVFEALPFTVTVDASAATAIIEELRALYTFLGRELGLKQADACLAVLGGDATKRLEAALRDPSKFGPAKQAFMAGIAAGFDMQTEAGINAWMRSLSGATKPAPAKRPAPKRSSKAPKRKKR